MEIHGSPEIHQLLLEKKHCSNQVRKRTRSPFSQDYNI